jgi:single-strand DNA-binding protein
MGRFFKMNKIILMGHLTRDPELRYSQSESALAIAKFGIAINRRFKRPGDPDADFFNCTAFGKQAEFVEKYLKQGTKILLTGRVQNDNYTNREGQKVYSVQIIAEEIEFAESKAASNRYDGGGGGDFQQPSKPEQADAAGDDFMNLPDGIDDLPFP